MKVTISANKAMGTVKAPPSKSIAHRLLISAALCDGESLLYGISDSDDMKATLSCLTALGAVFTREGEGLRVKGVDPHTITPTGALYCNESGSTLRFLLPVALLSGKGHTVVTGVTLRSAHGAKSFSTASKVLFRPISAEEAAYYVDHYQPYDKAGSYGIQEWIGYVAIEGIEGSFFNVMGLPIQRVYVELEKFLDTMPH